MISQGSTLFCKIYNETHFSQDLPGFICNHSKSTRHRLVISTNVIRKHYISLEAHTNTMALLASWVVILCMLVIHHVPTRAQQLTTKELEQIDDVFNAYRVCKNIPAISIALARGGDIVLTKAYGTANIEKGTNATAKTPFCIASITKMFTATLLAKLMESHGR